MELKTLTCPSCGASLQIPEGKERFFCTFCGSEIQIDDGTIRVDITNRIIDVARLKELELDEQRRVRREQAQKNKRANDRRSRKIWLIACIIWIVIGAAVLVPVEKSDYYSDECIAIFMSLLMVVPPFLTITMPKSFFKNKTQPTVGAKVGIWFVLMIGGCFCMGAIASIINAII